jgi:hypothetical protein
MPRWQAQERRRSARPFSGPQNGSLPRKYVNLQPSTAPGPLALVVADGLAAGLALRQPRRQRCVSGSLRPSPT